MNDQIMVSLADVPVERLRWLSPGRLAHGKLTILDGDPGLGKSTLLCDWAARVSRGQPLPDGAAGEPRGVVLLSAEDGLGDTIVPRLRAAGADLKRIAALVHVPDDNPNAPPRFPMLPDDVHWIATAVAELGAALVVIDPFVAYLSAHYSSHRDQDVRRALAPLAEMAEEHDVAVVLVRHLNKNQGGEALYRGGGSIGIIGAARSGLLLGRDPDDEEARVLAVTKCNLAKPPASLGFRLEAVPGTDVARVAWTGARAVTAGDLLAARHPEERNELDEAVEWLRGALADGPQPSQEIQGLARRLGFGRSLLRQARRRLEVQDHKHGFGKGAYWAWRLPLQAASAAAPQPPPAPDAVSTTFLSEANPSLEEWRPRGKQTCSECGLPLGPGDRPPYCRECRPYPLTDP